METIETVEIWDYGDYRGRGDFEAVDTWNYGDRGDYGDVETVIPVDN